MATGEIPYRPLDISKREIRLLSLHPGTWSDDADWSDDESSSEDSSLAFHETDHDVTDDDVVRCTLHTVSLEDNPEYEALSYVWGDLSERAGVVVDGICTMVTVNLQRALRRLRLIDKPRIIWADALCINQGDNAERGHQVGMMKDVFSACTRCVIWLGEEEDFPLQPYNLRRLDELTSPRWKKKVSAFDKYLSSQGRGTNLPPIKSKFDFHASAKSWLDVEAAFDLVKTLADDPDRHLYEMPFYQTTQFPQYRLCEKWQNAWASLLNILGERPWWRRTWTLQEAVLPRACIVQLAEHQIGLELLTLAASMYFAHDKSCCEDKHLSGPLFLDSKNETIYNSFYLLHDLHDVDLKMTEDSVTSFSIYDMSSNRHASDPRDSIFGMLGLFPDLLSAELGPDYNKSTAMVYSEATRRLVEGDELLYLEYTSLSKPREHLQLPSWVLDWGMAETLFPTDSDRCNACGPFSVFERSVYSAGVFILPMSSHENGRIAEIGAKLENEESVFITLRGWKQRIATSDLRFWTTLLQGRGISESKLGNPMLDDDIEIVQRWWHWISAPDSTQARICWGDLYDEGPTDDMRKVSRMIAIFCRPHIPHIEDAVGMRYFVTDLGWPGLAKGCIEVGDEIHTAKGGESPLILRHVGEKFDDVTDEMRPHTYQFVSTCYVDGIMNGEGVQGDVPWRRRYLR